MLKMPAGKFSYPLAFCVYVESYNRLLHAALLCLNEAFLTISDTQR